MENTAILREWFERVDSNNTGTITASQLKSALSVGNLDLSTSVVQQMIRMYDFDRNGTMSFEEFVALNIFLLKVQHAFADQERSRGFLAPDDVYESFDQNKNGRFRLDDFISLSIFVQSLLGIYLIFSTQPSKVELHLTSTSLFTARRTAEYELGLRPLTLCEEEDITNPWLCTDKSNCKFTNYHP